MRLCPSIGLPLYAAARVGELQSLPLVATSIRTAQATTGIADVLVLNGAGRVTFASLIADEDVPYPTND
jgi:hypothetical protein